MNETQPPPIPTVPPQKSGLPTWAIVLIALGGVGLIGIAIIGLLAAIAIPNFVRARETAQMNACINNLRQIDGAKQQWALENKMEMTNTPTASQLEGYLHDGQLPVCPAGGTYTIHTVGEDPTCSVPKHRLPTSAAYPTR